MKDYGIYSIAKAGLENLTKTLARELAPQIRVNAVAPGAILLPSDGSSEEKELLNEIPLKRIGTERDISEAVIGLTKFSYVTGQILKIDGGRSLN
jgi:pteridine reductase